jgi:hypothetical protein
LIDLVGIVNSDYISSNHILSLASEMTTEVELFQSESNPSTPNSNESSTHGLSTSSNIPTRHFEPKPIICEIKHFKIKSDKDGSKFISLIRIGNIRGQTIIFT